jgi:hypothetical protein
MCVGISVPAFEFLFPFTIAEVWFGGFQSQIALKVVETSRFQVWIKVVNVGMLEEEVTFGMVG